MENPSASTVIRFVAFYANEGGFAGPVTHLVLGHGDLDTGRSHAYLAVTYGRLFRKDSPEFTPFVAPMYAGYLSIENGEVTIPVGGSSSLGIEESLMKEKRLLEDLAVRPGLRKSLQHLFPLILAEEVEDAMIAS